MRHLLSHIFASLKFFSQSATGLRVADFSSKPSLTTAAYGLETVIQNLNADLQSYWKISNAIPAVELEVLTQTLSHTSFKSISLLGDMICI